MRICSFTLPEDLADWAHATAKAQDRSASSLVRQALLALLPEISVNVVMPVCGNGSRQPRETPEMPAPAARDLPAAGGGFPNEAPMTDATGQHMADHLAQIAATDAAKAAEQRAARDRVARQNAEYLSHLGRTGTDPK